MPPRFPAHALTTEPAMKTAATEAKKLYVGQEEWRAAKKGGLCARVTQRSGPPSPCRLQHAICAPCDSPCDRARRGRLPATHAHTRSFPPISQAARSPLFWASPRPPHSWPFLAGLATSGAIFFKIATSVTGEQRRRRRRERGGEREEEEEEERERRRSERGREAGRRWRARFSHPRVCLSPPCPPHRRRRQAQQVHQP